MKRRCRLDRVVESRQLLEGSGRVQCAERFVTNQRTKTQPVHSQDESHAAIERQELPPLSARRCE